MVTFRELWDNTVAHLVANASTLGLTADKILKGSPFQKMPRQAPYVYVYCLPSNGDDNALGTPTFGKADISIFCADVSQGSPDESLIKAVELAGKIVTVMSQFMYCQYRDTGIEVEPNSQQTTAVLIYEGRFDYA